MAASQISRLGKSRFVYLVICDDIPICGTDIDSVVKQVASYLESFTKDYYVCGGRYAPDFVNRGLVEFYDDGLSAEQAQRMCTFVQLAFGVSVRALQREHDLEAMRKSTYVRAVGNWYPYTWIQVVGGKRFVICDNSVVNHNEWSLCRDMIARDARWST